MKFDSDESDSAAGILMRKGISARTSMIVYSERREAEKVV